MPVPGFETRNDPAEGSSAAARDAGAGQKEMEFVEGPSPCSTCVWLRPGAATCDAYPRGIPTEIRIGQDQHRSFRGDEETRVKHQAIPASTTAGPVQSAEIRGLGDDGGEILFGALWIGEDGSFGFMPDTGAGASGDTWWWNAHMATRDATPREFFDWWTREYEGSTYGPHVGKVRLGTLEELARRLGWR